MCGIIGIVREGASQSRDRLVAARDLMWHRGPDDAGVWAGDHACLGARRLSIIDLTLAGHQPMVSDDGRRVMVFNGEIYNFHDLRRQLEPEFTFHSRTDGEVILHGYRKWGFEGLLNRLDGMFGLAVWDEDLRTLFGARDRAGKKPFHYLHEGRTLQFASTVDALLALLPATPPINPHALDAYLVYQTVPAPLSMFHGLRQLPPAHSIVFHADTGACTVAPYWRLSYARKTDENEHEVLDHVESLVRHAVKKRLESDVPVGVFLSGGVDSSLVAALAAQESRRPIDGVILGFDEPEFDERRYARLVSERLGMRLHEETLQPALVADLPSIVWNYGQPVADVSIVPNHYLAHAARRWMTVSLSGDGGDELFGGYTRPMVAHVAAPYRRLVPAVVRRALGAAFGGQTGGQTGGPLRRVALLAGAGATTAAEAFVYDRAFRRYRGDAYAPAFLAALAPEHPDALYRAVWNSADGLDDVDRALYGDFKTYLPDQLLVKADRASMAHGLEARSPLLDQALIEYAATIPTALRLKHFETKYVLKAVAARFVPPQVVYRRKRGFVMPASRWLRGELSPYVRAALDTPTFYDRGWVRPEFVRRMLAEHATGARDWGEQIFTLLVLEVWARQTLDRSLERGEQMDAFLSAPERSERRVAAAIPARLRTLQLGMEWFPEKPGGLNRLYYEMIRQLNTENVEVHGLVAGTERVRRDSGGIVEGFAPHSEALLPRLLAVRRMARPLLRRDPGMLLVTHFALYAAPLLGELHGRPMVVHFHGPWGLEGEAEQQSGLTVLAKSFSSGRSTAGRRASSSSRRRSAPCWRGSGSLPSASM